MNIKILGGKGEIGGNKILVEHKGTRILLDFGMSFGTSKLYFSEFLQPRTCGGLQDFFEMGLLPDTPGLYRQDFLDHMGREQKEELIDAVFLSHAHADHATYLHFLHWDIPVYCTKGTKLILEALQETGSGSIKEFLHVTEKFRFYENSKGAMSRVKKGIKKTEKRFEHDRVYYLMDEEDNSGNFNSQKVKIGSLEIECCPVDHSLPGACGYIIYSDEGTLAYSGDIRFHGYNKEKSHEFVEKLKSVEPTWLLLEGTRIDSDVVVSEEDVCDKITKYIAKAEELVFIEHPIRDLDRVYSIYQATKANNREFAISLKLAFLIQLLGDLSPFTLDDVKIFIPKKSWGLICNDKYDGNLKSGDYFKWEKPLIERNNTITYQDLIANPNNFVVSMNMFEIKHLIDIQPTNAIWIKSSVEPFSVDMELDEKQKQNWLDHFKIPQYKAHASGHASGDEIRKIINTVQAKNVIAIHTEHPESYESGEKK